eukprot:403346209
MGRVGRKGNFQKNKKINRDKVKRPYKRDIDQIVFEDLIPENTQKLLNQAINEDLPGLGQHYCVTCARYMINDKVMQVHLRTKEHKKRFKIIKNDTPYTHEEAERAAGLRPAKKRQ